MASGQFFPKLARLGGCSSAHTGLMGEGRSVALQPRAPEVSHLAVRCPRCPLQSPNRRGEENICFGPNGIQAPANGQKHEGGVCIKPSGVGGHCGPSGTRCELGKGVCSEEAAPEHAACGGRGAGFPPPSLPGLVPWATDFLLKYEHRLCSFFNTETHLLPPAPPAPWACELGSFKPGCCSLIPASPIPRAFTWSAPAPLGSSGTFPWVSPPIPRSLSSQIVPLYSSLSHETVHYRRTGFYLSSTLLEPQSPKCAWHLVRTQ